MTPQDVAADVLDSLRGAPGPVTAVWLAEECGLTAREVSSILRATPHAQRTVAQGRPRWVYVARPPAGAARADGAAARWRARSYLALLPATAVDVAVALGVELGDVHLALGSLHAAGEVRRCEAVWVPARLTAWQEAQRRAVASALGAGIAPGEVATWTGLAPHVARAWMAVLKH